VAGVTAVRVGIDIILGGRGWIPAFTGMTEGDIINQTAVQAADEIGRFWWGKISTEVGDYL